MAIVPSLVTRTLVFRVKSFWFQWLADAANASARFWISRVFVCLALYIGSALLMGRLVVNNTSSVAADLLWRTDSHDVVRWDYVLFHKKHPYITTDKPLLKQVACLPGQRLWHDDAQYYCDGFPVGMIKKVTASGKPLVPFEFDGVIPAGALFVTGQHPDSFDSRYWGFVPQSEAYKAIRIWNRINYYVQ